MYLYEKYIFKKLFFLTICIALFLTIVACISQAVRFIDFVVRSGISFFKFFELITLFIPATLTLTVPISVFIAISFAINRMQTSSELISLKSFGLSYKQITKPILLFSGITTLFCLINAAYLSPLANQHFFSLEHQLQQNYIAISIQDKIFLNPLPGITIYIDKKQSNGECSNIFIHDSRDEEKIATITANKAILNQNHNQLYLELYHGLRQEYNAKKDNIYSLKFSKMVFKLALQNENAFRRNKPIQEMFLHELLLSKNPKLIAEAHFKIQLALLNVAVALIAILYIAKPSNREYNYSKLIKSSLMAAVTTAIVVALGNVMDRNFSIILLNYLLVLGSIVRHYRRVS